MKRILISLTIACAAIAANALTTPVKVDNWYDAEAGVHFETYEYGDVLYVLVNETTEAFFGKEYLNTLVVWPRNDYHEFKGYVVIPNRIRIDGMLYPVKIFAGLSINGHRTHDRALQIVLPETIEEVFDMGEYSPAAFIKSINWPKSCSTIGFWYYTQAELVIPERCKHIGPHCVMGSGGVTIEDGALSEGISTGTIYAHGRTLELPGSVRLGHESISAPFLEHLIIKKSKYENMVPYFESNFIAEAGYVETVTCEYETPPEVATDAFKVIVIEDVPIGIMPPNPNSMYNATLYVPEESVAAYAAHPEWGRFSKILPMSQGVGSVSADSHEVIDIYGLDGVKRKHLERGINIVRRADGSVTKLVY